jgi:hypothetical protein
MEHLTVTFEDELKRGKGDEESGDDADDADDASGS